MEDSFIMIARKFFYHHLWQENRAFSRAEGWLDLLQTAAFAPDKRLIKGVLIEIPRGGIVASVRFLSDRWKWSNTKVCLFLDGLEAEGMIKREKRHGITLILLCKYEIYNSTKRRGNDAETTPGRQPNDELEEGKEPKKAGEIAEREVPSWPEVKTFSLTIGIAEWKAQDWFNEMEGVGWVDYKLRPIMKWRPVLTRVKTKWEADGRPSGPPINSNGGKTEINPEDQEFTWKIKR